MSSSEPATILKMFHPQVANREQMNMSSENLSMVLLSPRPLYLVVPYLILLEVFSSVFFSYLWFFLLVLSPLVLTQKFSCYKISYRLHQDPVKSPWAHPRSCLKWVHRQNYFHEQPRQLIQDHRGLMRGSFSWTFYECLLVLY